MSLIWFAQETETSCVAACLRMVLSSFGEIWSETELKEILGNPLLGVTLAKAQAKLSETGAKIELDTDLNLDDLRDYTRKNVFPMVGVERHILGYQPASHAVVVVEEAEMFRFLTRLRTNSQKLSGVKHLKLLGNLPEKKPYSFFPISERKILKFSDYITLCLRQ